MSSSPQEILELAFLGCGEAAAMHRRALSRVGGVNLHFASQDEEKAAALRDEHGSGRAFGSYEDALRDPHVEAVMVTTPPALHLELTLQALDSGKDVIVEKPAFLRVRDFEEVRGAMADTGRRALVAENYFYKPLRERLHWILEQRLVGDPLFVEVNAVKTQEARGWRSDPDLAGGGALFEGGIHWINFMSNLGLRVDGVAGHRVGRRAGPERSALVVLEYAGGAVGALSYSWEVPSPLRGLRISKIYGTDGSVRFESNGAFVLLHGTRTRLYCPRPLDISGFRAMFTDLVRALRTGDRPGMTLEMAERDVRLVRRAYDDFPGETAGRGSGDEAAGGES